MAGQRRQPLRCDALLGSMPNIHSAASRRSRDRSKRPRAGASQPATLQCTNARNNHRSLTSVLRYFAREFRDSYFTLTPSCLGIGIAVPSGFLRHSTPSTQFPFPAQIAWSSCAWNENRQRSLRVLSGPQLDQLRQNRCMESRRRLELVEPATTDGDSRDLQAVASPPIPASHRIPGSEGPLVHFSTNLPAKIPSASPSQRSIRREIFRGRSQRPRPEFQLVTTPTK